MQQDVRIRVLIAHDNHALRATLADFIASQTDMELSSTLPDGNELIAQAELLQPDVVLLDLSMPGCGLRGLETMAARCPQTKVVVLAMDDNIALLRSVLALGSLGYVVHVENKAELLSVIRKMHSGRAYIDVPTGGLSVHALNNLVRDDAGPAADHPQLINLSKREREVLEAVAYGYTNREIAEALGVSVKSIETYRYRVADKLSFKNRADLVRFALETGLLSPGRGAPALAGDADA
ncbi:MAG: response regulator transcription factor [Acidobacteriota bacterium]